MPIRQSQSFSIYSSEVVRKLNLLSAKFILAEHVTCGRILLLTFLAEKKRECNAQRSSSLIQSLYFFVNVHFTPLLKCTRSCI